MGLTGPGYTTTPSPQPKKRPAWVVGGATILSFVVLLYVVELFDSLSNHRLDENGIRPLETDGLMGIIFAPLLHANWDHLIANTIPALILGFLMTLAGMSRFIYATAIVWILGGFGTWLIGNIGAHCPYIGASCETNHSLSWASESGLCSRSGAASMGVSEAPPNRAWICLTSPSSVGSSKNARRGKSIWKASRSWATRRMA